MKEQNGKIMKKGKIYKPRSNQVLHKMLVAIPAICGRLNHNHFCPNNDNIIPNGTFLTSIMNMYIQIFK